MERFTKTKFFLLLNDKNSYHPTTLEKEYIKIAKTLSGECASASDREGLHNALGYTLAELKSLSSDCNNSKKMPFLTKSISLFEMQMDFVIRQMLQQPAQQHSSLKWTGSIVEWVELIYALYLVKRINNGNISLNELFQQMGEIFDFEVKEFSCYFMDIKRRKDEHRTKFTDLLQKAVLERMIEADRKPSRK
jgi:hypothetical protein